MCDADHSAGSVIMLSDKCHKAEGNMSNSLKCTALLLGFLIAAGSVQPAIAFKGPTTKSYCTEMVVKKGITDIGQFKAEVHKCMVDPTTYK
jgi:hypothetical protein